MLAPTVICSICEPCDSCPHYTTPPAAPARCARPPRPHCCTGLRGGAGFLQSVSKRISGARSDYYEATAAQRVGRRMLDQLEGAAAAALSSDGVSGRHLLKAGGPNVLPKLAALQKLNLPAAAGAQQAVVPAAGKA